MHELLLVTEESHTPRQFSHTLVGVSGMARWRELCNIPWMLSINILSPLIGGKLVFHSVSPHQNNFYLLVTHC